MDESIALSIPGILPGAHPKLPRVRAMPRPRIYQGQVGVQAARFATETTLQELPSVRSQQAKMDVQ